MKTFVETQLEKLVVIKDQMHKAIQEVKGQVYKSIGRKQIPKSDQEIQAEVEVVVEQYKVKTDEIEKQIEDYIKESEKKAYQAYYAAETKPTDDQIRESEQLVRNYNASKDFHKMEQFILDLNFHVENETVKAMSYVRAFKELFPDNPLNEGYRQKMNPQLADKVKAIEAVKDDSNKYELYKLQEQALTNGSQLDPVERIAMMNKAFELGGNGNALQFGSY